MIALETLLGAAIGAGLSLAAEVGFGDEARRLKAALTNSEKARNKAFQRAFSKAEEAVGRENLEDLLNHRPFRESVVTGLLDPVTGFDPETAKDVCGDRFPLRVRAVNRFFYTLETELLNDKIWRPTLERYQQIRFRKEVLEILRERQMDVSDREIVSALSANLDGSGAIAQGEGAVAVGERGVHIAGDIRGGFAINVTGDNNVTKIYAGSDPEELRRRYLQDLVNETDRLPLDLFHPEAGDPRKEEQLCLSDVYIALDTTELEKMEREEDVRDALVQQEKLKRVSAQQMMDAHDRLVLLGDPGSGKTTLVNFMTHALACAGVSETPQAWIDRLRKTGPWRHGSLLPVRVVLRMFAAWLEGQPANNASAEVFIGYLQHSLSGLKLEKFWDALHNALLTPEEPLLILLDGLDEVPEPERPRVVAVINDFVGRYGHNRFIVTCRIYAYVDVKYRLNGFRKTILAPFTPEHAARFVDAWYAELAAQKRKLREDPGILAAGLKQAVSHADLRDLATRPLLLTVMALLHTSYGQLPEDRVELYQWAVDLLFQKWKGELDGSKGFINALAMPGIRKSALEAGIYKVAFDAHAGCAHAQGTADITEGELLVKLRPFLAGDLNKTETFIHFIRERSGLLIRHKTDAYTFPHRTFQEFLAACHLVGLKEYPKEAARFMREKPDLWRVVYVLAAGHARRTHQLGNAVSSVGKLIPRDVDKSTPDAGAFQLALVAGQALIEIGSGEVERDEEGPAVLDRIRDWLVCAMTADKVLVPLERVEAGNLLSRLGDPRFNPDFFHLPKGKDRGFVPIRDGEFMMGSDKQRDSQADDDETPMHRVKLSEYAIARYPVTVAQFNAFLKDSGHRMDAPNYDRDNRFDNHPVVQVSWNDAVAYCQWLTEKLKEKGLNWRIGLPTEAQWERAARGKDGLIYPWGDQIDDNRLNYNGKIGSTSPVGCFPSGRSPEGLLDMSGNVWEWCEDDWHGSYKDAPADGSAWVDAGERGSNRVLRGGSWRIDAGGCRAAYRRRNSPDGRYDDLGFRLSRS